MRRNTDRVSGWAVTLAIAVSSGVGMSVAVPAQTKAPAAPVQGPAFRSEVDVVIVEATAVDRSGAVVKGLGAADFQVEIGGHSREIVSVDLVEHGRASAGPKADPDISTNVGIAAGRTVLVVIDRSNLGVEGHSVVQGARHWLATLGANDRVGLVTLPLPGPRVEFTTEHALVDAELARVMPVTSMPMPTSKNVSIWEALRIQENDTRIRDEVVARECSSAEGPSCPGEVDMVARDIAMDALTRVQPVLGALHGLMRGLGALPGPKHMVLISSGWPIDQMNAAGELSSMAADAALSNVTVHTFTAEQWAMAASVSRMSPRASMDRDVLLTSVEMLAGLTGGRSARLSGNGDGAFKALSAGLTGYYRLGVRPAPEDLDGKSHRISLKVTRSGVSLAGYRKVMAGTRPGASSALSDPTAALRAAVGAATSLTGLDLRATSYVLHPETGAGTDTLRIVVVGDVARAVTGRATMAAVLFDQDGKSVGATSQPLEVPATGPARLLTAFAVKPGTYLLRVAVRDAEGHIGSVGRTVEARWHKTGGIATTDLALFHLGTEPGSVPQLVFDDVSLADQVVAQVSLSAPPSNAKAQVSFDVTRDGTAAPLLRLTGRIAKTESGATVDQAVIPVSLLPPGEYHVTASIQPAASPSFTRTFHVAASAPAASTAAATAAEGAGTPAEVVALAGVARSAPRIVMVALAKPTRFATATVLDPSFVAPVFDRLAARSDTGSVREALERVKAGPWPTDGDKGPLAAAPVAAHFVAGLGRLQQGDLENAANDFRAALRAAPDFVPAMMYLGACYAAGNKDKEAASAWQTALLRDRDSPALQRLAIDAWLRAERPASALALIRQARQRWPADETFVRQQAQAALGEGRRQEGLDLVRTITRPDDPLLFLALATLYEAARDRSPVWDPARDLAFMRELRDAYAKVDGQSLALVDTWIAEIAVSGQP